MLETIFSTPIYIKKDDSFLEKSTEVFNSFGMEKYYKPQLYGVSGFTTYFDNNASEKIKTSLPDLVIFLEKSSRDFIEELGYSAEEYSISVGNMWFSEMKENSSHPFHLHADLGDVTTLLCGTYYLSVPECASPITFSRSEGEYFNQVNLTATKNTPYTRRFFDYAPDNGSVVLFFPETFHGVLVNKSKLSRKTLSFNIKATKNAT